MADTDVIELVTEGPQGIQGVQGDIYEFSGGEEGQVWSALPDGSYGWHDVEIPVVNTVAIVSADGGFTIPEGDSQDVQALIFNEHPAVGFRDTDSGIPTLTIDLHAKAERNVYGFVNQEVVQVTYEQAFVAKVYLLDKVDVPGHTITVAVGGVSEEFVSGGLFGIGEDNLWSEVSSRMVFKGTSTGRHVAYDKTTDSWVLLDIGTPSVGDLVSNGKVNLLNSGMLPASYGDVSIDTKYEQIPKEHYSVSEPQENYNIETQTLSVGFAGTSQTGYIIL